VGIEPGPADRAKSGLRFLGERRGLTTQFFGQTWVQRDRPLDRCS
jgi:hypothetical protein